MAKNKLYIDQAYENENLRVVVAGEETVAEGVLAQDITLTGSATWNHDNSGALEGTVTNAINGVGTGLNTLRANNLLGGDPYVSSIYRTFMSLEPDWTGSTVPSFSVPILITTTKTGDMPMGKIGGAMAAVAPTEISRGDFAKRIKAPLNYVKGNFTGSLSVNIGKWFKTGPDFVAEQVQIQASKDCDSSGQPLFVTVTFMLKPAIPIDADTVKGYFT